MSAQVTYHGTRAELKAVLAQLPAMLAGKVPDKWQVVDGIAARIGVAALSAIQQDFLVKSRGGTGRDGIRWEPLKRSTIARRPVTPGEKKALGITGPRTRGLLTPAQDKRWRQIYGTRLARLRLHMSEGEARARAAQIAWAVLKSEGAKTKIEVLGGRAVDSLRDTGRLLRSLSPGVEATPSGEEEQVFRTEPGQVIVGTNVPYAKQLHEGIPGRLPARPFWPLDGTIPAAWLPGILDAAKTGLIEAAKQIVQHGGR